MPSETEYKMMRILLTRLLAAVDDLNIIRTEAYSIPGFEESDSEDNSENSNLPQDLAQDLDFEDDDGLPDSYDSTSCCGGGCRG